MNLSGILVTADKAHFGSVLEALSRLDGIEVHQHDAASGRIVLVQEAPAVDDELRGCLHIRSLPHVINVDLVCHYFGDEDDSAAATAG